MSLSKKDYTAIADAIHEASTKEEIVMGLKKLFAYDNPRFVPDRFVRACGCDPYGIEKPTKKTPEAIVYVEGGVVHNVSCEHLINVIMFDQDNIDAGDPPPISEADMQSLNEAKIDAGVKIKAGKFFRCY